MLVLFYISLPLVKETSYCRKNPNKSISTNNECLCTAGHHFKQKNKILYGKEMHQHSIHIAKQVHVYKPKYKTLPFLFNTNQPMPDDQFIF
jgi:hypothetical protein